MNKLKDVCNIISGYAFKADDLNDYGDIPVIKIGNITNKSGVLIDKNTQYVTKEFKKIDKKFYVENGDILISLTGSHINQPNSMVGRCCRNYSNQLFLLNQRAGKVIPFENKVDKDYLYYLLSTESIKYTIANMAYGGANQVNVSPKDILNIKYNIPDIDIQKKISTVLLKYDLLIENNNKRILTLEQMVEEIYKEWFVRFRFPRYEKIRFENGIPISWEIKCLGDFGIVETGKTPSTEKKENYGDYIMFVKTPDMHNNMFVTNSEENLSEIGNKSQIKKKLPPNSIMVSCIGTGGVVAINAKEAHTNQQINSIILNNEFELEWLYFTCKSLKSTIEMFGATGATMTNLSKGKFERLKVIKPDTQIVKDFNKIVNPLFEQIKNLIYQNENLIKQRDLLLPRLMSGKLEVK